MSKRQKVNESKTSEAATSPQNSNSGNNHNSTLNTSSSSAAQKEKERKNKLAFLEERLKTLTEENAKLRSELKEGKEATTIDESEKKQFTEKLRELVESRADEEKIWQALMMYKEKFSDYGQDRKVFIDKHLEQLDRLLCPSQITKLCLWCLHEDEMLSETIHTLSSSSSSTSTNPNQNLWKLLCETIGATQSQQEKFKSYRENAKALTKGLRMTINECNDLKERIEFKNKLLEEEMKELESILTPVQLARFLIFVDTSRTTLAIVQSLETLNHDSA